MLIADVAGHGESVAEISNALRHLTRKHINAIRPDKLFRDVNAAFAELPSEEHFATSIVNSFFMPTRTLSICSAGHPLPLIRRVETGRWESISFPEHRRAKGNIPFGLQAETSYSQLDLKLQSGDQVLCFTDGALEVETAPGRLLGNNGLLGVLNELSHCDPAELLPRLNDRLAQIDDQFNHSDDVTVLLFQANDQPVTLRDSLAAPFRWFVSKFVGRR